MRWATTAAAVEAAATGLILLLSPVLFGRLIFGADLSEAGPALGRLAGIALVGFALATGAAPAAASQHAARASLIYNLLATIYLGYVGATGHLVESCCGQQRVFMRSR